MRVLRVFHSGVVDGWRDRDRAIRAQGVDVTSVSASRWNEGGTDITFTARPGESAQGVRTLGRHPALFVYDPRPLWRLLGQHWDVLDLHEEPFSLAVAEIRVLRWLRACHAPYTLYSAQNLDKTYSIPFRWLERSALRHAGGLQTCNTAAADICVRKGFAGQPRVIPLGVDTAHFAPDKQTIRDPRTIGYVGRLEAHKGVDVLLRATASLPDVRLEIVGSGPYADELRSLTTQLGISQRVIFVGAISYADLPGFYRRVGAVVLPSLTTSSWVEQFGRVAVEAMACEAPVIASDSGALPEVIGDAGLIVAENDPAALAHAISSVMSTDTARNTLQDNGLRRAADCDWSRVGTEFTQLYRTTAHTGLTARQLQVVVVAYHSPDLLRNCLAAIDGASVTVVDNSSDRAVREVVEAAGAEYVDAGDNVGFGGGVNLALRRFPPGCDVLLLNPDAQLTQADANRLHQELVADPSLASLAAAQTDEHGVAARVAWPWPTPVGALVEAAGIGRWRQPKYAIGSILLLRAEALAQVGGFDPDFFLYAEETDWARRAARMGWRHAVSTQVTGMHVGSGTSSDSDRRETHFYAGQERYLRKHHGTVGWQVARAANVAGALARGVLDRHRRPEFLSRAGRFAAGPLQTERRLMTQEQQC